MDDIQINVILTSIDKQPEPSINKKKIKKDRYEERKQKRIQRQQQYIKDYEGNQDQQQNIQKDEQQQQNKHIPNNMDQLQVNKNDSMNIIEQQGVDQLNNNKLKKAHKQVKGELNAKQNESFSLGQEYLQLQEEQNQQQQQQQQQQSQQQQQYVQNLPQSQASRLIQGKQIRQDGYRLSTKFSKQKLIPEGEEVQVNQYELPEQGSGLKKFVITEREFEKLDFISKQVKKALSESQYINMTDIQFKGIPSVYDKKNVILRSVTGSGKTLAYMVPLMSLLSQREQKISRTDGTIIIIICPTRELAIQCVDVGLKCGKRCPWVVVGGLLGGENPQKEKARLRKGVTILVGTPGRILYHLKNTQSLKFDQLATIVFEEWDRLLDMGFERDIVAIVEALSETKPFAQLQKILVSAHASNNIATIPDLDLNPDTFEMIGFDSGDVVSAKRKHKADRQDWLNDEVFDVPSTLSQYYTFVWDKFKGPFLLSFVMAQRGKKCIIFVATCDEVEYYAQLLEQVKFISDTDEKIFKSFTQFKLHGNIEQKSRSATYFAFRKSKENAVLISTSVASRGLDFPDVSSILLFDPPDGKDDYINKVGRTARIDQNGSSLLLLCDNENTREFISKLSQEMKIEEVEASNYYKDFKGYLKSHLRIIERMPDKHLLQSIRQEVKNNRDLYLMARKAYISFLRAYSRLKSLKVKSMNLHELSKTFGLEKAISTETKTERYQKELQRTNREKFRNQGVELNSDIWDTLRKKRRVVPERELNKLEFV